MLLEAVLPFSVETQQWQHGITVLNVHGSINAQNFQLLEDAFKRALSNGQVKIVLDLAQVSSLSSVAAGVLMQVTPQLQQDGGNLVLIHVPEAVCEVLSVLNLLDNVIIANDLHDALKFF